MAIKRYQQFVANGNRFVASNDLNYRVLDNSGEYPVDSFTIKLYVNQKENNYIHKEKYLNSDPTILKGTLRSSSSMTHPVITVQRSPFTPMADSPSWAGWNYCYIPVWERYYFISEIIMIRNDLLELHMDVDVLTSYASAIESMTARVVRNEFKIREELSDMLKPVYSYPDISTSMGSIQTGNWSSPYYTASEQGHLLIKVIGQYDQNGVWTAGKYGSINMTGTYQIVQRIINALQQLSYEDAVPITDYLISVSWSPLSLGSGVLYYGTGNYIRLRDGRGLVEDFKVIDGRGTYNGILQDKTKKIVTRWAIPNVNVNSVRYRNYAPFRSMSIKFQPFGQMELDCDLFGNAATLYITCEMDMLSGDANLYCGTDTGDTKRVLIGSTNIFYDFSISAVGNNGKQQIAAGAGAIATIVGGGLKGGFAGLAAGTAAGYMGLLNAATQPSRISSLGGSGNIVYDSTPVLIVAQKQQRSVTPALEGYLCDQGGTLSEFKGFTICSSVHVQGWGVRRATKAERDEIESLLKQGVIFES